MTPQGGIVEFALPGDFLTFTAGAAITGGQMVYITGANRTVQKTAALNEPACIGVALFTVANTDANLTVATDGVWGLIAAGAITRGDCLVCAAAVAGTVSTIVDPVSPLVANAAATTAILAVKGMVGKALESIVDTATGRVKLML